MGKGKRNRAFRDQHIAEAGLNRALGSELDNANADVRRAEEVLLRARRRAAAAANQVSEDARLRAEAERAGYGAAHRTARERVKRAHLPVDLDDAGGRDPQDQASAFFNRPGDYFLARFAITSSDPELAGQEPPVERAQTVLKASEDQFDYLLEVLRQIRGGFGERCRIELFRTHTVQQQPVPGAAPSDYQPANEPGHFPEPQVRVGGGAGSLFDMKARAAKDYAATPARRTCCATVRGSDHLAHCFYADEPAEPDLCVSCFHRNKDCICPDGPDRSDRKPQPHRDLTREEIQQQLPGMTRAQAAAELGVQPDEIGGTIQATGDLQREQLASELGIPVESLMPIEMSGGGNAYAIAPEARAAEGRHAAPEPAPPETAFPLPEQPEPEHVALDWWAMTQRAWAGPGLYVIHPREGDPFNKKCEGKHQLDLVLRAFEATHVYRVRPIADNPQA